MPKPRGKSHTSLTETAEEVVRILKRIPNVKMIAPGQIKTGTKKGASKKYLTISYTTGGFEMLISGQSTQKVAVHTENPQQVATALLSHKKLAHFFIKERVRKPGQ